MQYLLPSPMETFKWPKGLGKLQALQNEQKIEIFCKRDDLIHPIVSGNKYRKLVASMAYVKHTNFKHILSFGGGYSNHLHALGYLCMQESIKLTVCVRGDYSNNPTPMLKDIAAWGVNIQFITKQAYQNRVNKDFCQSLLTKHNAQHVIPEGGSSAHCFAGIAELYNECITQKIDFTHILLPVASAGTLAGLIHAQSENTMIKSDAANRQLLGIAMLKGEGYLETLTNELLASVNTNSQNESDVDWQILHKYHHGGYAKASKELLDFVDIFNQEALNTQSPFTLMLEPVYSGKTFFALKKLIETKSLPINSRLIVIHTGGLQGMRS